MYADKITRSMQLTIDQTNDRREKQLLYNEKNGITPTQIVKASKSMMGDYQIQTGSKGKAYSESGKLNIAADPVVQYMNKAALEKAIEKTKISMEKAAKDLNFQEAARLRDEMYALQELLNKK
jgi:excinuclease ABC subunit B